MGRDEDEMREWKEEMEQDARQDQWYEQKIRTDHEFMIEEMTAETIESISEMIEEMHTKITDLGWNIERKEIVELIS